MELSFQTELCGRLL